MKITDIVPDFSTMTDAQVEEIIRGTRRSRTTTKAVTLVKRPTKEAAKSKTSVEKALAALSPEQLSMLKKLLS